MSLAGMQGFFVIDTSNITVPSRPLQMKSNPKPQLPIGILETNISNLSTQWLKPSEVSALLGLDEKWLAAAREGRKELYGPPYIKLGKSKTSPVRYPLDKLIHWMNSFPVHRHHINHTSFKSFQYEANQKDVWPFVLYEDGSLDEIFRSINSGKFAKHYRTRTIIWLAKSYLPSNLN